MMGWADLLYFLQITDPTDALSNIGIERKIDDAILNAICRHWNNKGICTILS